MRISAFGLAMDAPLGWDVRIRQHPQPLEPEIAARFRTHPVLHTADFALREERGDFGSGAVEGMRPSQAFVALIEYHPDSARTPLFFSNVGMPRYVGADDFSPRQLQRTIPGQGGTQVFFVEGGRAFCLYIVLGSMANRRRVVPRVNATLSSIEIESRVPKEWAESL